jgi:sugar lactone lactonase YvrE
MAQRGSSTSKAGERRHSPGMSAAAGLLLALLAGCGGGGVPDADGRAAALDEAGAGVASTALIAAHHGIATAAWAGVDSGQALGVQGLRPISATVASPDGAMARALPSASASADAAATSPRARDTADDTAADKPASTPAAPAAATFELELPAGGTTSAGVFDAAGRLVRTLWSGEPATGGRHAGAWDGRDHAGTALPAGAYELRVLQHRVQYVWEGVVGNSSGAFGGARLHKAFLPPTSLAAGGDRVFYAVGYNEAQSGLHGFTVAAPEVNLRPSRRADPFAAFTMVALDGRRLFWANTGGISRHSFVAAVNLDNGQPLPLPAGRDACLNLLPDGRGCWPDQDHRGVIGLETDPAWAPTGLAVQANGRLLAVAHGARNVVRLYDKHSGALLRTLEIPLNARGSNQIAFSPRGDLWVIVGRVVRRYVQPEAGGTVPQATITGLAQPLAVTVDPADEDAVWVADGGNRQQLRRHDRNGRLRALHLRAGGQAEDPEVLADRVCFQAPDGTQQTGLAVTADRALWLVDTCNNRILRLQRDGRLDAPVAYLPAVYAAAVDLTQPQRVFANYLEFEVDVTRPLAPGRASWVLRRNWLPSLPAALVDAQSRNHGFGGFRTVVTLGNGRTYAVLAAHGRQHLVELPESGPALLLRTLPAPGPGQTPPVLYEDGDLRWAQIDGGRQTVWRQRLEGFEPDGTPRWAAPQPLAAVPTAAGTPFDRGGFSGLTGPRFPVTETGRVVFFDPSVVGNEGFHLGAASPSARDWLWLASPSAPMDGRGSFQTRAHDAHVEYGGNAVWAAGRHIVFGYHGEFHHDPVTRRVGQANQFMHFWDNGLFVGQFGVPSTRDAPEAAPGLSGNAFSPTLVRAGGKLFLIHNDESAQGGVHRWRIDGADTVREWRVPLAPAAALPAAAR